MRQGKEWVEEREMEVGRRKRKDKAKGRQEGSSGSKTETGYMGKKKRVRERYSTQTVGI